MKKSDIFGRVARAAYHYLVFFLLVALLVSCTMTLFVSTLSKDLGVTLNGENLNRAAKLTFISVVLLSALIALIDLVRRKLTTERITKHIADATGELVRGNFKVRIKPVGRFAVDDNYRVIIESFNKMAEELGSLETLRTDFIANVSHEMKTPLAIIQNYATLLQNCTNEKEKNEYTQAIGQTVNKMSNMITNILKLNQLENQQIYPQIKEFDLSEQLCTSLLQYETVWESKDIEISTEIEDEVYIHADQELLSLVWNNLLSNAFKFTPFQGKVSVRLIDKNDYVLVQVEDTGCGMSAEIGKHIFEKFYQADRSHATQGNGLGLALVKKVIDIVQGEISVVSKIHVGTTFSVKLAKRVHEQ